MPFADDLAVCLTVEAALLADPLRVRGFVASANTAGGLGVRLSITAILLAPTLLGRGLRLGIAGGFRVTLGISRAPRRD